MTKKSHPISIHVGKRLKICRNLAGISQATLGNKIGVAQQQIQNYETGSNPISLINLFTICDFLDAPITYFFEGLPQNKVGGSLLSAITSEQGKYSEDVFRMLTAYCRIQNPEMRLKLCEVIEALGKQEGGNHERK